MAQKELYERIIKELSAYHRMMVRTEDLGARAGYEGDEIVWLMKFINQHVAEVIGGDEEIPECPHDEKHPDYDPECGCLCGYKEMSQNELKAEQRKKAGI